MTKEELEKENAELKQNVIDLENDREIFLSDFYCDKKGTCKLTEAKELLKQWLQTSKASGCDNINIVAETEQFIKE